MRRLHLLVLALLTAPCLFSQTYTIKTIAGGAPLAVGGPATNASVGFVFGVAVDAKGNLFFTSSYYSEVLRVDAQTGILSVVAGNGTAGHSGDGGPATSAQLTPNTIAVDPAGNVYVADVFRVRKISNGVITTVAGTGVYGFSGDGGPATMAQISSIGGLAVDSKGNLFIADTGNNSIREVSGGIINTVAGEPGAQFFPTAIAVSPGGGLYVYDSEYYGTGSSILTVSNGVTSTVAGTFNLQGVTGIAIDSTGNVYIAFGNGSAVEEVSNGVVTTWGGVPGGFSGDNGPATSAQFWHPYGVAVDGAGNVYIADSGNSRVRKVASGVITTVAGNGLIVGDGGPATSAVLSFPSSVAVDTTGNVFIGDTDNELVRKVSNGIITTASAVGTAPQGVAVDAAGDIFVSSPPFGVEKTSNGVTTTVINSGGSSSRSLCNSNVAVQGDLEGVAVDSAGNIYLADTGIDCIVKDTGGMVNAFAGSSTSLYDSGDGGPALDAVVSYPWGLAVDPAGDVFFTETNLYNTVRKVSDGVITAVAGMSPPVGGFAGDNGPATSAQLTTPEGVAVDASGNIFIADSGNNRIRKISNGVITTIAGTGTANFSGDGGPATAAELNFPAGVAVDAAGNVYVADQNNNRIRMLIPSGPPSCTASATASTLSLPAAGGTFTVTVQAGASCSWAIQNLPSWITWSGNPVGTGPAVITLNVAANTTSTRSTVISVAGTDLAITQMAPAGLPVIAANGIVPIYSNSGAVQPGSWVSIFGSSLATETALWNNDFPTSLGGVTVTFNGVPGYLWYVSPGQINLQVPDLPTPETANVVVMNPNGTGASSSVQAIEAAPSLSLFPGNRYAAAVILTPNGSGAYQNGSYDLAGPSGYFSFNTRPVKAGETLVLYGVGFGPTNPTVPAGQAFTGSAPTVLPVTVSIGGVAAQVLYSGITSAGLYQINLVVPVGAASGDQLLVARVTNIPSGLNAVAQSGVYITVQ